MINLTFRVEGTARGYSRDGAVKRKTPKPQREWRALLASTYLDDVREAFPGVDWLWLGEYRGRVELDVTIHGLNKADATNLLKEIEDALNGIAYRDDRQVVRAGLALPGRTFDADGVLKQTDKGSLAFADISLTWVDLHHPVINRQGIN